MENIHTDFIATFFRLDEPIIALELISFFKLIG